MFVLDKSVAAAIGNSNDLTIFCDREVISAVVDNVIVGCVGFFYCIRTKRDVLQLIDTIRGFSELAVFCIVLIYRKFCTAYFDIGLILVVLANDNAATLDVIDEGNGGCFAGFYFDFLYCRLYISVRCFHFFNGVGSFVQGKVKFALLVCGNDFIYSYATV